MTQAALTIEADDRAQPEESHKAALGWAITHEPTRQAYTRCTGEDAGPALDRYREWIEANLIGRPGDITDDAEAHDGRPDHPCAAR